MGSARTSYRPDPPVAVVRTASVSRFLTVTAAPTTAPPEGSVTVPERVAEICANDPGARSRAKARSGPMAQRQRRASERLSHRDVVEGGERANPGRSMTIGDPLSGGRTARIVLPG